MPPPSPSKKRRDEDTRVSTKPGTAKKRGDEDNEQAGPEPRKRMANKSGMPMGLIICGIVGGGFLLLFCCGGVGALGYFFLGRETKKEAVAQNAQKDKNDNDAPPQGGPDGDRPPIDKKGNKEPDKKKEPLPKPANWVTDASVSFRIDADSQVKDLVFAHQTSRVAYLFWNGRENLAKHVDVWDWKTAKKLVRVTLPDNGDQMALSPAGTRLMQVSGFPKRLHLWSIPDGQLIIKDWDVLPKDPKMFGLGTQLAGAFFTGEDRVLVVAESGQVNLWDAAKKQIVYTIPAPKLPRFLMSNPFARAPQNFHMSPDGKWLAISNGDGCDLIEVANGKTVGKTDTFRDRGMVGNFWSLSFNRGGTLLAIRGNYLAGNKPQEFVAIFEVPSGKRRALHPVIQDFEFSGPISWIGPRHLLLCDGNVFKGAIFNIEDGKYYRLCKTSGKVGDRFAVNPPDERLWYVTREHFNTLGFLVGVDLPVDDLARGPAPDVKALRSLPVWGCFPRDIRQVAANEL
jgi:hypothetical protein